MSAVKFLRLSAAPIAAFAALLTFSSAGAQQTAQSELSYRPYDYSSYPYINGTGSQVLVDTNNNRTDLFPYSNFTGRSHGDLFYRAPQTRTLVDDRPFVRTLDADFIGQYAIRRAGMRQLDAQNRRSGYRLVGTSAPAQQQNIQRTVTTTTTQRQQQQAQRAVAPNYQYSTYQAPRYQFTQQYRYIQPSYRYYQYAQPSYRYYQYGQPGYSSSWNQFYRGTSAPTFSASSFNTAGYNSPLIPISRYAIR